MERQTSPNNPANEELTKALQDGLIGRRALLRAYEGVCDRTSNPQLKQKLESFADDERQEYERAAEITRTHGGDPGVVHNVKEEVAAFLGKTLLTGGKDPFAAARGVAMLHGLEASGHAGAIFLREIAKRANEPDWIASIDQSIDLAQSHMQFLQQQAQALGQQPFQP